MRHFIIITAVIALIPLAGMASSEDDPTSLSYISYLERYASVQPPDGENSLEAAINMPLVTGDRVDLARDARMEIVLADGNTVWLNEYSTLSLDSVAFSRDVRADRTVLFLADGNMIIEVPQINSQENRLRVDSGQHTIYLTAPGVYRVDVLASGNLWVEVWEGLAEAAGTRGGVLLRSGTTAEVGNGPISAVQASMVDRDDFSRWVQSIRGQQKESTSALHIDTRYSRQASQLDSYGTWIHIDATDSWGWRPSVSSAWEPYTAGRWYWTPTGWSWLSYEPWGWMPYHYGTWNYYDSYGWVWGWGNTWSPAWVYWSSWPGYVGWCPVGAYSSWWVGAGWGWGGLYFGGSSYHSGHGGGGHQGYPGYRSGRNSGTGRPGGIRGVGVSSRRPTSASDYILNMEGHARSTALSGRGWSAVPAGEFGDRGLSRSVRPASDFLRAGRDDKIQATISAKPLITDSPRRVSPGTAVQSAFRQVEGRSNTDLSRIVARDSTLTHEEALRLGRPSLSREVVTTSRSNSSVPTRSQNSRASASRTQPGAGSISQPTSSSRSRETLPNAYRSSIPRNSGSRSDGSRPGSTSLRPSGQSGSRSLGSSSSGTSSRQSIHTNSLHNRGLSSESSSRNNSSMDRSRTDSSSRTIDSSTINSSPRGSSSSIASPGRSRSPIVIPGSSNSGGRSSQQSSSRYSGRTTYSRPSSSHSPSQRASTPSSSSRSYSRPSISSSSSQRSYTPSSSSRSYSRPPISSSSSQRSSTRSSSSRSSSNRSSSSSHSYTRSSSSSSRPSSSSSSRSSSSSGSSSSRSSSSHSKRR